MKLGPRYHVVGEIARGGMGVVLLALRSDAGGRAPLPVAIKQLHAHLVDNAEVVTSFIDEARIASRIHHPNVVNVIDVEMVQNQLVIVMEYVEGVPLRDLVRSNEQGLPVPIVRRIMVDALNGLHAAHELADEQGTPLRVVHRDVSPHNLLVGLNGVTRVTDFGIAMAVGRIASTKADGAVKGKLQYLSPEQVFRKGIDRRTDVFAAGVVAWEAIVGRKLFDAGTEGETLAMILREPIPPPSFHRIDVPLDLDETILKALERESERRWESAYELARALEEGGPLATREEVEALVVATAGESLIARRQLLGAASSRASVLPTAIEDDDALTTVGTPLSSRGQVEPLVDHAAPTIALRRRHPLAGSPLVLLVVASLCVCGGLLAGFSVRSTPSRQPSPSSEPTTTQAPIVPSETSEPAVAPPPAVPPRPPPPPGTGATAPARTAPPAHRPQPHGGARRTDAGRGSRPFMPDDL